MVKCKHARRMCLEENVHHFPFRSRYWTVSQYFPPEAMLLFNHLIQSGGDHAYWSYQCYARDMSWIVSNVHTAIGLMKGGLKFQMSIEEINALSATQVDLYSHAQSSRKLKQFLKNKFKFLQNMDYTYEKTPKGYTIVRCQYGVRQYIFTPEEDKEVEDFRNLSALNDTEDPVLRTREVLANDIPAPYSAKALEYFDRGVHKSGRQAAALYEKCHHLAHAVWVTIKLGCIPESEKSFWEAVQKWAGAYGHRVQFPAP